MEAMTEFMMPELLVKVIARGGGPFYPSPAY